MLDFYRFSRKILNVKFYATDQFLSYYYSRNILLLLSYYFYFIILLLLSYYYSRDICFTISGALREGRAMNEVYREGHSSLLYVSLRHAHFTSAFIHTSVRSEGCSSLVPSCSEQVSCSKSCGQQDTTPAFTQLSDTF